MTATTMLTVRLHAASAGDAPATFHDLLKNLGDAASKLGVLLSPLTLLRDVIHFVLGLLDTGAGIIQGLGLLHRIAQGVQALLNLLVAIPVVGEIIEAINTALGTVLSVLGSFVTVLNDVKKTFIDEGRVVFQKIDRGVTKAQSVVKTASDTIPATLNSVNIVSYCVEVGEGVITMLGAAAADTDLKRYLDRMTAIKQGVEDAFEPLAHGLQTIESMLDHLGESFQSTFQGIKDTLEHSVLGSVIDTLSVISHSASSIIEGIAPVRWALQAIAWVTDHIFKPVIDKLLEWTGLKQYVDDAVRYIEKQLGIDQLIGALDTGQKTTAATGSGDQYENQSAAEGGVGGYVSAVASLRQGRPELRDELIRPLVENITKAVLDPSKHPRHPPRPPVIEATPGPTPLRLLATGPAPMTRAAVLSRATRRLGPPPTVLKAFAAGGPDGFPALFMVADHGDGWTAADELVSHIHAADAALGGVQDLSSTLSETVRALQDQSHLPASLASTLGDLDQDLGIIQKYLDLFGTSLYLHALVDPLRDEFGKQRAEAAELRAAGDALPALAVPVLRQLDEAVHAADLALDVKGARQRHQGWITGLDALRALLGDMRSRDPQGRFKADIDALQQAIEQKFQAAVLHVDAVGRKAQRVGTVAGTLNAALGPLRGHLYQVSVQALDVERRVRPALGTLHTTLRQLDGIYDPVEALASTFPCKPDEGTDARASAGGAVLDVLRENAAALERLRAPVAKVLDICGEAVLPLRQTCDIVHAAAADLRSPEAITTALTDLSHALEDLRASLVADQQYTTTEQRTIRDVKDGEVLSERTETVTVTVNNLFVDGAIQQQAQTLLERIHATSPEAL